MVNGVVTAHVIDSGPELDGSPMRKPFLRLKFEDGRTVDLTTNVAEMIGGLGKGTRERHSGMPTDGDRPIVTGTRVRELAESLMAAAQQPDFMGGGLGIERADAGYHVVHSVYMRDADPYVTLR